MRTGPEKNSSGPGDLSNEAGTTAIEIQFTDAEMAVTDAAAERLGMLKTDLLRTSGLAAARAALDEETNSVWSEEAFDGLCCAKAG